MMALRLIPATATALVLGLASGTALQAQSMAADLGEFEYMNSCAACHGVDADGKGALADLLKVAPPDLTMLQQNNGGVFPVAAAYDMIEGASMVGAHGTREMPAWGQRYTERVMEDADFAQPDAERYPTARILALIEYLANIQK